MAAGAKASGLKRKAYAQKKRKAQLESRMVQTDTFSVPKLRSYPLGGSRKVTMIYAETFNLNPPSAGVAAWIFRANSCFDPSFTGVGHQPRGFDQLMSLYDHGTVIGSKIDIGVYNGNSQGLTVACTTRDNSTPAASFDDLLEVPTISWTICPGVAGGGVTNLTNNVSVSKFMGRPNVMTEDDLRFTRTFDAPDQCFYHVYCGDPGAGDPAAVQFQIRIEYVVVLTEPTMPIAS